jgi:hypothetical protein
MGKRMTSIFSVGDVVRKSDLKEKKAHLKHVDRRGLSPTRSSGDRKPRRSTGVSTRSLKVSPKHSPKPSPTRSSNKPSVGLGRDSTMNELEEMEAFMYQLQGMDPKHVEEVLGKKDGVKT